MNLNNEIIIYQTEDGQTKIDVHMEGVSGGDKMYKSGGKKMYKKGF